MVFRLACGGGQAVVNDDAVAAFHEGGNLGAIYELHPVLGQNVGGDASHVGVETGEGDRGSVNYRDFHAELGEHVGVFQADGATTNYRQAAG